MNGLHHRRDGVFKAEMQRARDMGKEKVPLRFSPVLVTDPPRLPIHSALLGFYLPLVQH